MINKPHFDFQEVMHVIKDDETGLKGVIAVHSTALGPAAGGCRMWRYPDAALMMTDAIRLARGMSYKNALADLPFGGGKAVLQLPEGAFDRPAVFRALGRAVEELNGMYVTAEDVGTTIADMHAVRQETRFVAGLSPVAGNAGGDPSPWTAQGVFECIAAAWESMLGLELRGATVAVQGAGSVGSRLCELLAAAGARLIVADLDPARAATIAERFGARRVGIDEILGVDADILAPCALGGVLNDASIPRLTARLICGGANNQLEDERHGEVLRLRGIVYAPDYVVNAGGIINVAAEYLGENSKRVRERVSRIAPRLLDILSEAERRGAASSAVADERARDTIASARRVAA